MNVQSINQNIVLGVCGLCVLGLTTGIHQSWASVGFVADKRSSQVARVDSNESEKQSITDERELVDHMAENRIKEIDSLLLTTYECDTQNPPSDFINEYMSFAGPREVLDRNGNLVGWVNPDRTFVFDPDTRYCN